MGKSPLSKLFIALSAIFGAIFGMTFAQRKGSELREKMRKATKKGHSPLEPLIEDFSGAGKEVAGEINEFGESDTVQNLKTKLEKEATEVQKKAKKHYKKGKSEAKKHIKKAKKEGKKKISKLKKEGKRQAKKLKKDIADSIDDAIEKGKDYLD